MKTSSKALILFYLLLIFLLPQIAKAELSFDLDPRLPCDADDPDTDDDDFIDICDIEGLYLIRNGLDGKYELRRSLDFHSPLSYRDNDFIYNWPPIDLFKGEFNGNGHTISNLQIDLDEDSNISANYVGLFRQIHSKAKISNVGLLNIDIVGRQQVGGLAGSNGGRISNSYVINTNAYRIEAERYVGGLVGENAGSIVNSYAIAYRIEAERYVGGLVGENAGSIVNSYAIGNVTGSGGDGAVGRSDGAVGGLVGSNDSGGTISNSRTTSTVVGGEDVGGLVGYNNGRITGSHAIGSVKEIQSGGIDLGGLVGWNYVNGTIDDSYAIVVIEGSRFVGGLVGDNAGKVINSHAESRVKGSRFVGGLVGDNAGKVINSHAESRVIGSSEDVGGLVGRNKQGVIRNSYATGDVMGKPDDLGGLVGENNDGEISNSYATGDAISTNRNYIVGGLVGRNTSGMIVNTYAIANVTGGTDGEVTGTAAAGGLVAYILGGTIKNSYAIGNVTGSGNGAVGALVGLNSKGNIIRSYAGSEIPLVGLDQGVDEGSQNENIVDSFISEIRGLRLPTKVGTTETEVYYEWSENDWSFGSKHQYPVLKYAIGSADDPACGALPLPVCGTFLSGQQANLNRLFVYTHIRVLLEGALQQD